MKIPSLSKLASGGTKNTVLLGVVGIAVGIGLSTLMKKIGSRTSYYGYWGEGKDAVASRLPDPGFAAGQSGGFYGQFIMTKNDGYLRNSVMYNPHSAPPPVVQGFTFSGSASDEKTVPFQRTYF